MSKYGIRGTANSWFANYLTNRKQYTCLNGKFSAPLTLKCGVPQGSILGPLLFILYVNDISNVSNKCSLVLFADDTNIFFTDNNASNLERLVCEELQKFNSWFAANKLSLNVGKTKYMVFNDKNPNFNISMDGGCISRVDSMNFLGVFIDSHLSWSDHISHVKNQVSKGVGVLSKLKHILPRKVPRTIYVSLIFPHLSYCSIIWSGTSNSRLKPLSTLQNRAIRNITSALPRTNTTPMFASLNLLKLKDIITSKIATFTYQCLNGHLPARFDTFYIQNKAVHNYSTRQATDLHSLTYRSSRCQLSPRYRSTQIWNNLPQNLKLCTSVHTFKNCIFKYLKCCY